MHKEVEHGALYRFAKSYGDQTYQTGENENDSKYVEEFILNSREIYLGLHPPRNGDISQWRKLAAEDPMPLSFSIVEITKTFTEIFIDRDERTEAISGWRKAVEKICEDLNCKTDFNSGIIPSAEVKTMQSPDFGGNDGFSFSWLPPSTVLAGISDLSEVVIRSGTFIESIMIKISDGVESAQSLTYGGRGGSENYWRIP